MSKTKTTTPTLEELISKIERILDKEIEDLPHTIALLLPEKRIDLIKGLLPIVTKYRENHSTGGSWEIL